MKSCVRQTQQKPIGNRCWPPVKVKEKYRNEAYSIINRSHTRRPNFRYYFKNLLLNYKMVQKSLKENL